MFDNSELEQFCNEELMKARPNYNAIQALLRNAAMLHDEKITEEQKQQALANIKAITHGPQPKQKKAKEPKQPQQVQQMQPTQAQQPQQVQPKIKYKYSPVYGQHYGVTEEMWNKNPDAHAGLFTHHQEVMAGKHPNLMHIKSAVEQQKAGMAKSVENLLSLFKELKKRI